MVPENQDRHAHSLSHSLFLSSLLFSHVSQSIQNALFFSFFLYCNNTFEFAYDHLIHYTRLVIRYTNIILLSLSSSLSFLTNPHSLAIIIIIIPLSLPLSLNINRFTL